MPSIRSAKHSSAHKLATLALYRALRRSTRQAFIPEENRVVLRTAISQGFRRNQNVCGQQIVTASQLGYRSLSLLRGLDSNHSSLNQIVAVATRFHLSEARHRRKKNSKVSRLASLPKTPSGKPCAGPIVWPYPGTRSIFERPYPREELNGPRHIPKFVSATGVPFLRIKKPQSPYLSRIIRDQLKKRQHRVDLERVLDLKLEDALLEDKWDDIVKEFCGVEYQDGHRWVSAPALAVKDVRNKLQQAQHKRLSHARQLWKVVMNERALAEKEKREETFIQRQRLNKEQPYRVRNY